MVRESDLDWTLVRLPMLSDKPTSTRPTAGYAGQPTVQLLEEESPEPGR